MTHHDYSLTVTGESLKMPTLSVSPEIEATVKKAHYANVSNVKANRKYRKYFKQLKKELRLHALTNRALSTQQDLLYSALAYLNKTQFWLSVVQGVQWFVTAYLLYERLF